MTARIAGYVSRKEWGALPPKATTPLNGRRMLGIAVHHGGAGGYADHAKCASQVRAYQRMHLAGDRGPQNDIAYNMLVCRHGYVFEGRTLLLQGGANGTSAANRTYFSVCVLGDGDAAFSSTVTDALEWVINQARTRHNAADAVKRHRDFVSTGCPGTKLSAWTPKVSGKPIQTVSSPGTPGTVRIGDRGSQVVLVQEYLDALGYDVGKVDGVAGAMFDAAVRDFQTRNGLAVDGVAGPDTITQLRSKEAIMAKISDDDVQRIADATANKILWAKTHPTVTVRDNDPLTISGTSIRNVLGAVVRLSVATAQKAGVDVADVLTDKPREAPALDDDQGGPDVTPSGYVSGV